MSFIHGNVVDLYITYELDTWSRDLNKDFSLGNCLFGAVKLLLPLKKTLELSNMIITVGAVFHEENKNYPQCLYNL